MTKTRSILLTVALTATVAIPLAAFLSLFLATRPSLRVLRTWASPPALRYDDLGTRYLSVVEGAPDFDGFPIHVGRRYFLYVGMDAGTPSYGHCVAYSPNHEVEDLRSYLRRAEVTWTPDGVTFAEPSGHRWVIPKQAFLGGR